MMLGKSDVEEDDEEKLRHVAGYLGFGNDNDDDDDLPSRELGLGLGLGFGMVRSRVTVGWELQVEIDVFGR